MSTLIFDQLTGPFKDVQTTEPVFEKTIKYGLMANVSYGDGKTKEVLGQRRNALFTNVLTPFGKLSMDLVTDVTSYDGYDARLVNASGQLDVNLVAESIKMSGRYRAANSRIIAGEIVTNVVENHTSVLFNLLRMKIHAETATSGIEFKPDQVLYDDGHVTQTCQQFLGGTFDSDTKLTFNPDLGVSMYFDGMMLQKHDYCVNLTGFTNKEISILAMAIAGWSTGCAIRIYAGCPAVATRLIANMGLPFIPNYSITDYTADDVDVVLMKLITNNRLESQFDLAYALAAFVMYTPLPRSVEANAWVSPIHRFSLPRAGSSRGVLPELTEGASFMTKPVTATTWSNYLTNPNRLYLHAIAATEAVYTSLYEVITNNTPGIASGWQTLGMHGVSNLKPYRVAMECCGLRFGKKFEVDWLHHAGPDFTSDVIANDKARQNPITVTATGATKGYETYEIVINGIKHTRIRSQFARPALFPVLSFGVNDHRYYLNSLKYSATMEYDERTRCYTTTSNITANKMLTALRVAGYDAELRDAMTGQWYKNWAANANGQAMPDVKASARANLYVMPADRILPRANRWIEVRHGRSELCLDIAIKPVDYALFLRGKLTYKSTVSYTPVLAYPGTAPDKDVTTVVIRTAGDFNSYYYQDFLLREADPLGDPPSILQPVGTAQLLRTDTLLEEAGDTLEIEALEA